MGAAPKRGEKPAPAEGEELSAEVPLTEEPAAGLGVDAVFAVDPPPALLLGAGRSTAVSRLPPGDPPPRGDWPAKAGAATRAVPATSIPTFK